MALKAVHVSDVPHPHENVTLSLLSPLTFNNGEEEGDTEKKRFKFSKFVVVGHRGCGMNMLQSSDQRFKSIKENSILSFNEATKYPIDFIEFDVQVTTDDYPVIFHDNFILTKHQGEFIEKRMTDMTLSELQSHGPQKNPENIGKPMYRKIKDGRIFEWKVENDVPICTLQDVFEQVDKSVGFNIELKFDDHIVYSNEELTHKLNIILKVLHDYAGERPIYFSTFQPDAAILIRKLQSKYPVFFLTNGGAQTYTDVRRSSLDEAINVCLTGGLQGIVSESKAMFKNPAAVKRIQELNLLLITYGELNNVPEVVYIQRLMGLEGVIVDLVPEIVEAVARSENKLKNVGREEESVVKYELSKEEIALLKNLIPELVHM